MKYPRFLKENDTIGITALSSGAGRKILEVKTSLNHLKKHFKIIATPNVWGGDIVSSSIENRIEEFNNLLDEDINALINLRGGEFGLEVLPKLDLEKVSKKKLLVEGFSDGTILTYPLTTKYDLATLYGFNAKSYDEEELDKARLTNLEFKKGNLLEQISPAKSINGDFRSSGVIIGGCIDAIRYLFGTDLDGGKEFVEKYKNKRIIWYFDNYALNSLDMYLTLLQMKNMGYFKYSDTFIFSPPCIPNLVYDIDYVDFYKKVFNDKNIVFDANIGHVDNRMTLLNGSLATIEYKNKELRIKQELMYEDNG